MSSYLQRVSTRVLAIMVAVVIACVCSEVVSPAQAGPEIETLQWPINPEETLECSALQNERWGECAERPDCTLVIAGKRESERPFYNAYACRKARGRCEQGFRQAVPWDEEKTGTTPESICRQKKGCKFVRPKNCWCPPGTIVSCYCSGGAPPMCK